MSSQPSNPFNPRERADSSTQDKRRKLEDGSTESSPSKETKNAGSKKSKKQSREDEKRKKPKNSGPTMSRQEQIDLYKKTLIELCYGEKGASEGVADPKEQKYEDAHGIKFNISETDLEAYNVHFQPTLDKANCDSIQLFARKYLMSNDYIISSHLGQKTADKDFPIFNFHYDDGKIFDNFPHWHDPNFPNEEELNLLDPDEKRVKINTTAAVNYELHTHIELKNTEKFQSNKTRSVDDAYWNFTEIFSEFDLNSSFEVNSAAGKHEVSFKTDEDKLSELWRKSDALNINSAEISATDNVDEIKILPSIIVEDYLMSKLKKFDKYCRESFGMRAFKVAHIFGKYDYFDKNDPIINILGEEQRLIDRRSHKSGRRAEEHLEKEVFARICGGTVKVVYSLDDFPFHESEHNKKRRARELESGVNDKFKYRIFLNSDVGA